MVISRQLFNEIVNKLPKEPPETGGIIGGTKTKITLYWIEEVQMCKKEMCSYVPNVQIINKIIAQWRARNIEFIGMFHTHYFSVKTLSSGDIDYMKKIIRAMPNYIDRLYFPIFVFPEKEMFMYVIERETEYIYEEKYELI